jgi:hypothetical protein
VQQLVLKASAQTVQLFQARYLSCAHNVGNRDVALIGILAGTCVSGCRYVMRLAVQCGGAQVCRAGLTAADARECADDVGAHVQCSPTTGSNKARAHLAGGGA